MKKTSKKISSYAKNDPDSEACIAMANEIKIHPVLQQYTGYLMGKATMSMRGGIAESLQKVGLSIHHFGILTILESGESYSQNRLGDELGVDKASMVKVIDELEKKDLVERVPSKEDRRVKFVVLTTKGKKAFKEGYAARTAYEKDVFSSLTEQEIQVLRSASLKVLVHLKKIDAPSK